MTRGVPVAAGERLKPRPVPAAGSVAVQSCGQPTNGVVYVRAFCSLPALPAALRPYVPLFCSVLAK